MENTPEFINIFQNLAFPVAINVVLFIFIWWFGKKILEDNRQRYEQMSKRSDEYIKFLQLAHVEQTGAIRESATAAKENAAALKENAQSLNRFSVVLEKFSTMIDKIITIKKD